MQKVRPKKALGQHFLTDLSIARRIAATLDDYRGLPVIEVGPGMGVLTRFLLEEGHDVKVAEIDTESIAYLRREFPVLDREGRILEGDFLQMNLDETEPGTGPFCVIGNYPYNISSQIFFKALDYRDRIPVISGMLQKEVAQRICSAPGGKVYGILSVLLQAWYDCEYLFDVAPGVFSPPPKVTSGVLRLTRNGRITLGCDEPLFKTVVKTAFGQRRKMLRSSLQPLLGKDNPIMSDPIMTQRPERLGVEDFVMLTRAVEERRKGGVKTLKE